MLSLELRFILLLMPIRILSHHISYLWLGKIIETLWILSIILWGVLLSLYLLLILWMHLFLHNLMLLLLLIWLNKHLLWLIILVLWRPILWRKLITS